MKKKGRWVPYVEAPANYGDIINRTMDRDRARCLTEKMFVRPYVPGEFWPTVFSQDTVVLVMEYKPGSRVRSPFEGDTGNDRDQAIAAAAALIRQWAEAEASGG